MRAGSIANLAQGFRIASHVVPAIIVASEHEYGWVFASAYLVVSYGDFCVRRRSVILWLKKLNGLNGWNGVGFLKIPVVSTVRDLPAESFAESTHAVQTAGSPRRCIWLCEMVTCLANAELSSPARSV